MKHSIIKKIIIALLIVAGVLLILFVSRKIAVRFFGYKPPAISESQQKKAKQVEVSLDAGENYKHVVTDQYIYFVNVDKVTVCDSSGKQKAEIAIVTSEPVVKSNGKYVIVGDVGGNNVYLLNGTDLKNTIVTKGALVDVSVNASGYCVLVTQGDMHKRDVTVYNTKGEEQFVWNSGSLFVLSASVADNNKNIIISTLDTQEGKMKSVLSFYNISAADPIATEEYENELIAAVEIRGTYVFCVGDSKACVYRVSGEKTAEIPYNGKTLITYKTSNANIVMAFSESALTGKRYDIESYNTAGKQIGTYELDYKIDYIDFAQDTIAISRGRLINTVDLSGREKKLIDPGIDIDSLSFIGGVSTAVGFTANGAYIFKIT